MEIGERVEDAVRREVWEEFHFQIRKMDFLGYYEPLYSSQDHRAQHWILLCFICRIDDISSLIPNEEVTELQWVTIDTFPSDEQLHRNLPFIMRAFEPKIREILAKIPA